MTEAATCRGRPWLQAPPDKCRPVVRRLRPALRGRAYRRAATPHVRVSRLGAGRPGESGRRRPWSRRHGPRTKLRTRADKHDAVRPAMTAGGANIGAQAAAAARRFVGASDGAGVPVSQLSEPLNVSGEPASPAVTPGSSAEQSAYMLCTLHHTHTRGRSGGCRRLSVPPGAI